MTRRYWIGLVLIMSFWLGSLYFMDRHAWAACTNTSFLGLCKSALGDAGWGTNWNNNADKIDDAVDGTTAIVPKLAESTVAGLPTCNASAKNQLRRVTDNIRGIWSCTGTAWVSVTGWADVRDFVTGGTGTSGNPWTGWESGVGALAVNMRIYFPGGYYSHSIGVIAKSGWELLGDGYNASIVTYTGTGTAWSFDDTGTGGNWRGRIQGLRITSSTGTVGVLIEDLADFLIRNSWIRGFSSAGVKLNATAGFYVLSIRIEDSEVSENSGDGVLATGVSLAINHIAISNSRIRGNTGWNLHATTFVAGWSLRGVDFEAGTAGAISISDIDGLELAGCYFEQAVAGTSALEILGSAASAIGGVTITGNTFYGTATATAIKLGTASTKRFHGGLIAGNTFKTWSKAVDPRYVGRVFVGPNRYESVTTEVAALGASDGTSTLLKQTATGLYLQDANGGWIVSTDVLGGTPGSDAFLRMQNIAEDKAFIVGPRNVTTNSFDFVFDYYNGSAWARAGYIERANGALHWESPVYIPVIATGSLPAAGSSNDGRLVIEDNGAGDRNLIIYAGGQRFRIDGGASF